MNTRFTRIQHTAIVVATLALPACASRTGETLGRGNQADVDDATSFTSCPKSDTDPQCPTGSYRVTCANGSKEVDTLQQIDANHVCVPPVVDAAPAQVGIASMVACSQEPPYYDADHQCPAEDFYVTCADGSTEVVSEAQIQDNVVCIASNPCATYFDVNLNFGFPNEGTACGTASVCHRGICQAGCLATAETFEDLNAGYDPGPSFYTPGQTAGACLVCSPTVSVDALEPTNAGQLCDAYDFNTCNGGLCCSVGGTLCSPVSSTCCPGLSCVATPSGESGYCQ